MGLIAVVMLDDLPVQGSLRELAVVGVGSGAPPRDLLPDLEQVVRGRGFDLRLGRRRVAGEDLDRRRVLLAGIVLGRQRDGVPALRVVRVARGRSGARRPVAEVPLVGQWVVVRVRALLAGERELLVPRTVCCRLS